MKKHSLPVYEWVVTSVAALFICLIAATSLSQSDIWTYPTPPLKVTVKKKSPRKREVTVSVSGEVYKAITLILPVGTRVCDLKKLLILSPHADSSVLNSKRRLKDGEKIHLRRLIPRKHK